MCFHHRDLNRQVATYFPAEKPESFIFRLVMQRWTVAFVRGLKIHLRSRGDLASELLDVLPEHELKALMDAPHRPMMAMQVLSDAIAASDAPTYLKVSMDLNLTAFEDAVGGCERILRTPLPLSYTRHTSRFLVSKLLMRRLVNLCSLVFVMSVSLRVTSLSLSVNPDVLSFRLSGCPCSRSASFPLVDGLPSQSALSCPSLCLALMRSV